MTDLENTAIIERLFNAFERGDIDGAIETFADDVTVFVPGPDNIPFAGHHKGKASVREYFTMIPEVFDLTSFIIHGMVTQGKKVVVNGHETGVARKTGKPFDNHWVSVFTIEDGLVSDLFEYHDTAALVEAFTE